MKTSWYKEPWAWFVFFLPMSAVVAGIATFIIANTDADTLVVGDYYKKGKAINLEITKIKHAQKLGISFDLKYTKSELVIKPTGIEKNFPLLNVNFYHPTLQEKDFYFAMTADASGNFRQIITDDIDGKWQITISPFEDHWKIQQTITLPQTHFIAIKPKPIEAK